MIAISFFFFWRFTLLRVKVNFFLENWKFKARAPEGSKAQNHVEKDLDHSAAAPARVRNNLGKLNFSSRVRRTGLGFEQKMRVHATRCVYTRAVSRKPGKRTAASGYNEIFANTPASTDRPILRLGVAISCAWKRERDRLMKYSPGCTWREAGVYRCWGTSRNIQPPFRDVVNPADVSYIRGDIKNV